MAFLTKDEYERRARAADRRMAENALVDTLTDEQHDTLAWLCSIRHKVHSSDAGKCLFYCEGADYDEFWSYIETENQVNPIKTALEDVNLPAWEWSCDGIAYDNDQIIHTPDFFAEDEREEATEKALEELYTLVERWNSSIENYLSRIDEIHGTQYCPTGALRI